LLALDRLSAVCDGELYVESAICDDYSPYRGGFGQGYPGQQMVMEFYPGTEYAGNATNYWAPTLWCMANMVRAAGFDQVDAWKLVDNPDAIGLCRGFVAGRKCQ
jgi:tRNA (mo5U34)-methyltransferase